MSLTHDTYLDDRQNNVKWGIVQRVMVDAIGVMYDAVENGVGDGGTTNHLGALSFLPLLQRKHSGLVPHCLGPLFAHPPPTTVERRNGPPAPPWVENNINQIT
jgi:hypothetical protein